MGSMPEAASPVWTDYVLLVLVVLCLLGLVMLVLNLIRMRTRLGIVIRQLRDAADSGPGAKMEEVVAQLQSASDSLDRIAARAEDLDRKLAQIVERGPGGEGGVLTQTLERLTDEFATLRAPLQNIQELLGRSDVERFADEVKRTIFNMGFDRVEITTDLATLTDGSGKVHVEVEREGVKSKGYLVLRSGSVVEKKISATYEMFP